MSSDDRERERVTVHLPDELPILTTEVSRTLLAILIELAEVQILDGPRERGRDDY